MNRVSNENPYEYIPETADELVADGDMENGGDDTIVNAWSYRGWLVLETPYQLPDVCCFSDKRTGQMATCDPLFVPKQLTFWMILLAAFPVLGPIGVALLLTFGFQYRRFPLPVTAEANRKISLSQLPGAFILVIVGVWELTLLDSGQYEELFPGFLFALVGVALLRMMEHNWFRAKQIGSLLLVSVHSDYLGRVPDLPDEKIRKLSGVDWNMPTNWEVD